MGIHPSAVVSSKAELGSDVSIGPFAIVEDDVIIGSGTHIGSHALVAQGTRIGEDCAIHHGAVVGTVPQDLKFAGERTTLEIGDRTVIREYATVNRGTRHSMRTVVGSDCYLMAYSHVAHDCILGDRVIMANGASLGGHILVEDWVILSAFVGVHKFTRLGQHCFVGALYRVPKDVPPFMMAVGDPLRPVGLNTEGLKRRGFTPETMALLKRAHRLLFRSQLNTSQAIAEVRRTLPQTPEIRALLEFIEKSERGIIK